MSLLRSSSFKTTNKTLQTTFLPGDSYVLSLSSIANLYAASASSPSNQIYLFDKNTLQICGLGVSARQTLLSSGKDGYVIAWDERSGSASIKMESGRLRPLLCCDASDDGMLVAAGTDLQKEDAFIIYWDPRNPVAQLRTHGSTHSDDITSIHFSKSGHASNPSKVLLSTSSDGLVSTSNALEVDEDEAVLHVGNWGCSVSQGGWLSETRIWAASDMETFSCWSNELDQLLTVDIRSPSLHDQDQTWVTDYLIQGHSSQKAENGLAVFVGSNEGDVALITGSNLSDAMAPWTIHSVWANGHSGIVRSLYWDEEYNVLVTGGEDSKIITWQIQDLGMTDDSILKQQDDLTDSEMQSLKREWDDQMDVGSPSSGSKRMRR